MGTMTDLRDIAAYVDGKGAVPHTSVTAGGSNDGSEVTGEWIDRSRYHSGVLIINYTTSVADGETLSFSANFEDATDDQGTNSADYDPYDNANLSSVVAEQPDGSSLTDHVGEVRVDVNLQGAKQFVRAMVTPTLSAGSADTVDFSAVLVVGGDRWVIDQPSTST